MKHRRRHLLLMEAVAHYEHRSGYLLRIIWQSSDTCHITQARAVHQCEESLH